MRADDSVGASPSLPPEVTVPIPDLEPVATNDHWWWDSAERAIRWLAQTRTPFTIDDVRDLGVPAPDHHNRAGAAILVAAQRGWITRVGDQPSTRPTRHGARIGVWVGALEGTEAA